MTSDCRKMQETTKQLQQQNEELKAQLEREASWAEKAWALWIEVELNAVVKDKRLMGAKPSQKQDFEAMTSDCRKMQETTKQLQQQNEELKAQLERETAQAASAGCCGLKLLLFFVWDLSAVAVKHVLEIHQVRDGLTRIKLLEGELQDLLQPPPPTFSYRLIVLLCCDIGLECLFLLVAITIRRQLNQARFALSSTVGRVN
eukprot:s4373_g1.t1